MSASQGYQLLKRIGYGAAGSVYLAETAAGQVAIRQFESQADRNSGPWQRARQQFLEAGRRALALANPRIVRVIEVIDEGGEALVVSEYVAAESLESALATRRFAPEQVSATLRDIATALDYAHEHGIVHGDLKTSKIFLNEDRVRVADFGISPRARLDASQPLPPQLVHPYLSPEHVRTPHALDSRSDLYSLAVIAYQM